MISRTSDCVGDGMFLNLCSAFKIMVLYHSILDVEHDYKRNNYVFNGFCCAGDRPISGFSQ